MKKKLPLPKKTLKTFILEEDAKVIDKTATKIAFSATAISFGMLSNTQDVHAQGHGNSINHGNAFNDYTQGDGNVDTSAPPSIPVGKEYLFNLQDDDEVEVDIQGHNEPVTVQAKEVRAAHANHYDHDNGGGQGG